MATAADRDNLEALRAKHPGVIVWIEVAPRMFWDGKDTIPAGGLAAAVKTDLLRGPVAVVESSGQVYRPQNQSIKKVA